MRYRITCSMLGVGNAHHLRGDVIDAADVEAEGVDVQRLLSLGAIVVAEDDAADAAEATTLETMTKAELLGIADGLGIEGVSKRTPNAELIEMIQAAQAAGEQDAADPAEDDGVETDDDQE